jgi:hypothetical protein
LTLLPAGSCAMMFASIEGKQICELRGIPKNAIAMFNTWPCLKN